MSRFPTVTKADFMTILPLLILQDSCIMWLGWGSSVKLVRICLWLYFVAETHLSLSASHCDIHESSSVCYSLLGSAFGCLLLLLRLDLKHRRLVVVRRKVQGVGFVNLLIGRLETASSMGCGETHLWCLRLDFSSTGKGSVNFTHDCGCFDGLSILMMAAFSGA